MRKLDFIVIGAQKCGTTSVYEYLKRHPQIYIPPEKEALYFSLDRRYKLGLQNYLNDFFAKAPPDCIWGTVTPHYMADMRVPARIAESIPDVKLIAILRDPIQRAISHYKMSVRRKQDERTLDDAVEQLLEPSALERSRGLNVTLKNEKECYLVWGEYGRILNEYLKWFNRNQLLVVFLEDLQTNSAHFYTQICDFLGVSANELPENLGKRYHVGGASLKYPFLERLLGLKFVKHMLKLVPEKLRLRMMFRYEMWNIKKDSGNNIHISSGTRKKLEDFYKNDAHLIRDITSSLPPWFSRSPVKE